MLRGRPRIKGDLVTSHPAIGKRFLSLVVAGAATLAAASGAGAAAAPLETPAAVTVDVQTYNLDLGADLTPLFGASSLSTLISGAAHIYSDVVASEPVQRMAAIAAIIAKQRPEAVGLQEVATWQLAPYTLVGGVPVLTGAYQSSFDFLGLLLDDLRSRGVPYDAVSANTNFDSASAIPIPVPISATTAARYIDRNVILVSKGLQRHASVGNAQNADFAAAFVVTLLGTVIREDRGWASIDVTERGRTFRFFDTHLEAYGAPPFDDQIRNPQAVELAGLADASPYPSVVVGDINARPSMCIIWRQPPDPQDGNIVAYQVLQRAGLAESWLLVHPSEPCDPASWTSGQDNLTGPNTLTHRIDDVFVSSRFSALQSFVVGDTDAERTQPDGLWPSDHASTVAKLRLVPAP